MKVIMEVVASNKAITDGSLPQLIKSTTDKIKPEATYFYTVDGCRSFFMVFDLKDPSEIPGIAEPFFMKMNAKVEFHPVMNLEDLQKGLAASKNP
jgi:hypothetical protein